MSDKRPVRVYRRKLVPRNSQRTLTTIVKAVKVQNRVDEAWQEDEPFQDRYSFMFETRIWTDFTLTVGCPPGEVEDFCVHRIILANSSPVFTNMFLGDLAEKQHALILDMKPLVFKHLLRFMYSGTLNCNFVACKFSPMVELLEAAEKYKILPLHYMLSSMLMECKNSSECCKHDIMHKKRKASYV